MEIPPRMPVLLAVLSYLASLWYESFGESIPETFSKVGWVVTHSTTSE
jgi:hypothetical protein